MQLAVTLAFEPVRTVERKWWGRVFPRALLASGSLVPAGLTRGWRLHSIGASLL